MGGEPFGDGDGDGGAGGAGGTGGGRAPGAAAREGDAQRARRVAALHTWCARSVIPGPVPDLSDLAALYIAAGRSGDALRAVLTARARAGVGVPAIGDYTGLRSDAARLREFDAGAAAVPGGARAMLRNRRADLLRRQLGATRSRVAASLVVHGGGLRGVRRERREGIHLTLDQREQVFGLLCWTPAPESQGRGRIAGFGQAAVADLVDLAATKWDAAAGRRTGSGGRGDGAAAAVPAALQRIERWAGAGAGEQARHTQPGAPFHDPYETLVYLCGRYFDRIRRSEAWNSEAFAVHRGRVDLAGELVELSRDSAELQSLAGELAAARSSASGGRALGEVDARSRALRPVWDRLVERLVSFDRIAEAMDRLDAGLRAESAAQRAESLDGRIDGLVGRTGGRMLFTEDLHRLGEEADSGDWNVIGYRSQVEREIEELTAARGR
ncbi:hypothetical protein [Tomitella fengzijianii]|uniref:hypothetical protein n=1 Tax=Tomitella fengzijianii TaxID=2597660 RepID=UPI00131E0C4C|nr:hypothetical protein [Tomitella fengzijianii]